MTRAMKSLGRAPEWGRISSRIMRKSCQSNTTISAITWKDRLGNLNSLSYLYVQRFICLMLFQRLILRRTPFEYNECKTLLELNR